MIAIILLVFSFFFLFSCLFRTIIFNTHNIAIYSVKDLYHYLKYKKWDDFTLYGIDMFIGMFGHGKTLSMTHRARLLYSKYGDDLLFISNYKLIGIPYLPLVNFNQLVDLGEDASTSNYKGVVVLIDEIENVLSHRNFAHFPLPLLHMLTQQRKKHVYIMCSAQRFFMVDKLFRSITTHVFDCNKYWRFQHCVCFDAWDLENSVSSSLIKRLANLWWFVKDSDFNSYDTSQMISKGSAEAFISNDDKLQRLGEIQQIEVYHANKKTLKERKKTRRGRKT